ncbi:MAG: phosphoribosylformylglycinamidine cyclo-ligase, partial [Candidatus Paceibacterota bacterium]
FLVSLAIDRNKFLIPGEVIKVIIEACQEVCDLLTMQGIPCFFSGGETADVPDLVRTITINNAVTIRIKRSLVIDASRIKAPGYIIGFSSTGQSDWEDEPNSGIGSNGLTSARHDTLERLYREYTETFAPETDRELIYSGKYRLSDSLPGDPRFTIASALLSPTRTYLPLIKRLIEGVGRDALLGLIHCSGGGQTKIGKFGPLGVTYIKDNLFETPPLFSLLQESCDLPWKEMYQTYSMGHRLEAVVGSRTIAKKCIAISQECGIDAQIIGRVVRGTKDTRDVRTLIISRKFGKRSFRYPYKFR